jgi:hypothetical protein
MSSPEEECERAEGPGRVELLGRLVPLCWMQTIRRPSHRIAYMSSPEEECERAEGPGRVELLGHLVPLCWEQTISRPSHRIAYLSTLKRIVRGRRVRVGWSYLAAWCHLLGADNYQAVTQDSIPEFP